MSKTPEYSSSSFGRFILWAVTILLFATFLVYIFEKTQITNFYSKPLPTAQTTDATRPVNDVKYQPATSSETEDGERIKENAQNQLSTPPKNTGKIDVSYSVASQDVKGGPIIVRAIISGATTGECKLTISGSNFSKIYTSEVINLGTYYGCKGFDIPFAEVPIGSYQATLEVNNNSSSGKAVQQIEVSG